MARKNGPVNMVDVAQRAGVSIATVSRALRGTGEVNVATRDRILQVADELGYVVSPEASALASRSTRRVAVVLPTVEAWFYATMLAGIEESVHAAGLDVMIYQVDGEQQRTRFIQELPARRKVDAVVLAALPLLSEEEQRLDLLGVHVIIAGGEMRDFPHVCADEGEMSRLAIDHLRALGHERVAMIRTSDTDGAVWSSDRIRTEAWTAAFGASLPPEYLVTQPSGATAGADGMARLWALPERPTAVLAYSDEIGMSAMGFLAQAGARVPDDVSIIGFDGHPMAEAFGLTTVSQSVREQGRRAGRMAAGLVNGDAYAIDQTVEVALVARASTAQA